MKQLTFYQFSIFLYVLSITSGWFLDAIVEWNTGRPSVVAQYTIEQWARYPKPYSLTSYASQSWEFGLHDSLFNFKVSFLHFSALFSTNNSLTVALVCFLYCLVINIEAETDLSLAMIF